MIDNVEQLEVLVAKEFDADVTWFYMKARYAEVIKARGALFWILMRVFGMSSIKIQSRYGLHNSTIRHAGYVAQSLIDTDPIFKEKIDKIKEICFKK